MPEGVRGHVSQAGPVASGLERSADRIIRHPIQFRKYIVTGSLTTKVRQCGVHGRVQGNRPSFLRFRITGEDGKGSAAKINVLPLQRERFGAESVVSVL
jgi:hypothetical protein